MLVNSVSSFQRSRSLVPWLTHSSVFFVMAEKYIIIQFKALYILCIAGWDEISRSAALQRGEHSVTNPILCYMRLDQMKYQDHQHFIEETT